MAFIGVLLVLIVTAVIVLLIGVVPIIAGTFLYHKTKHKKLGIALRIFGYTVILPVVCICVFLFMHNKF